jgi:thiaminase
MSVADALAKSSAKPAGKRPYFLNPETERVMAIAMAVAQELAVARARIDTLERLLEKKGVMRRSEIEDFEPSKDEAAERGLWIQEYLTHVLRILQQEAEAINATAKGDLASEEVAAEIVGSDSR